MTRHLNQTLEPNSNSATNRLTVPIERDPMSRNGLDRALAAGRSIAADGKLVDMISTRDLSKCAELPGHLKNDVISLLVSRESPKSAVFNSRSVVAFRSVRRIYFDLILD